MTILKTSLTISAALVAAGPAVAKSKAPALVCAPVTIQAVEGQFDKFNQAWATKDPETVTKLFSNDAVLLATVSNVPRTDHTAIKDYFVSFLKGAPVGTINTSTIKLGCDIAYRMST